jgi:hypothetical protein
MAHNDKLEVDISTSILLNYHSNLLLQLESFLVTFQENEDIFYDIGDEFLEENIEKLIEEYFETESLNTSKILQQKYLFFKDKVEEYKNNLNSKIEAITKNNHINNDNLVDENILIKTKKIYIIEHILIVETIQDIEENIEILNKTKELIQEIIDIKLWLKLANKSYDRKLQKLYAILITNAFNLFYKLTEIEFRLAEIKRSSTNILVINIADFKTDGNNFIETIIDEIINKKELQQTLNIIVDLLDKLDSTKKYLNFGAKTIAENIKQSGNSI